MNFLPKLILGAALPALAACVSSQQDSSARKPLETVPTETALNLFTDACLNTLPNFRKFESQVAKHGMKRGQVGQLALYSHPEHTGLFATSAIEQGKKACGVAFIGTADKESVSQQFMKKAMSKTGGKPKSQFPSRHFEFAYHMKNGSVFSYEADKKRGQTRHFIFVTPPVTRKEAFAYVYN